MGCFDSSATAVKYQPGRLPHGWLASAFLSTAGIYYGLELTTGEIVAIVVASAVFLPLVLLIVYLTFIRVKEQREKKMSGLESKEDGEAERMEGGGSEGEKGGEVKDAALESGSGWWFFRKSSGGVEEAATGDAALPAAGEKAAGEVASAPLADSPAAAPMAVDTSGAGKAERAGGGWRWPWQAAAASSAAEVAAAHAAAVAASGRGAEGVGATGGYIVGAEARPMVCRQYSLAEVAAATGEWAEANRIGSGSFGDVYKGANPTAPQEIWAVKRAKVLTNDFKREVRSRLSVQVVTKVWILCSLPPSSGPSPSPLTYPPSTLSPLYPPSPFGTQVNEMATKSHPNLVRLLRYCMDYDPVAERMEQIVIYEFVDNGDLDCWIGPRMGDVHSFGVVMLTLITARKAIYNADADQVNLKQWVAPLLAAGDAGTMRDPQLEAPDDLVLRMARLALRCTAMPTASRPSISRVLGELLVMKEEFLGKDEDRMAVRIDRDLEISSDVNLSMEIARAQGARSSGGLSSNP
ncbi:unnamed protein product [Closterium sp. Naga37s-1]|nr:unnamed protein product [Closterium sp. Naga37s-1]